MAAAEARAVWQRTANRCFIQEDAKRAPKLACCPSTSSLLSKQADTRPANTTDVNDKFSLNDKSSYSNLSSDSRWWLQLQPDYIYQRGLTNEQVNALEARNSHQFVENQDGSSINSLSKESYEFVEMDSVDCCDGFKELNECNMDSKFQHWMGIEKNGKLPWWQMAEKDDLASFVSKRSHDLIEDCDLPWPMHTGSKPQKIKCQNAISRVEVQPVTSKPISPLSMVNSDRAIHQGPREKPIPEMDLSKAKILEALRHSQTRAREAENAAKEAYAEKEHIVKLLVRQASQLFAYRQWLYLLQLENLYYQIKNNKNSPMSSDLPVSPRGVPCKTGKSHKNLKKPPPGKGKTRTRRGVGRYEHDISKYAVVFVVGLGLVGTGLLLGWTVGWMLL